MKGLGTCKLLVENPKTLMKYMVKFIVVDEQLTPPLLSRKAAEKMNLIIVNYDQSEHCHHQGKGGVPDSKSITNKCHL